MSYSSIGDIRSSLARTAVFSAKELVSGRSTQTILGDLLSSQWKSADEIRSIQWEHLNRLIGHAYAKVPYYRRTFQAAGIEPGDIRGFDDYSRLPILTKADLQSQGQTLIAKGAEGEVAYRRTSGSTGQPMTFPASRSIAASHLAQSLRGRSWWGVAPGDREFKLWGRAASFDPTLAGKARANLRLVKDWAMNVRSLSPFDLSQAAVDRAIELLLRDRPSLVFGYGAAIHLLATYLYERGVELEGLAPKVVIYTSEWLSQEQRNFIGKVFSAPVASEYGAVECGIIGYDAPCGSMHASDEAVFLETVIDDQGSSRLLVTHLGAYTVPLLRYDLGDLVRLDEGGKRCSCGRGLSRILEVTGRRNDLVRKPNGEAVHAELFDYAMRHQTGVLRYRVLQREISSIQIQLQLTRGALSNEQRLDIIQRLTPFTGSELNIEVIQVRELEPLPSGKFKWVVSHLDR